MQKNNPTDINSAMTLVNMFDMQHVLSGGWNTEFSLYTIKNLLNTRNNTMMDYYQGALGVLQQTSVINWHDLDQSIKMRNEDRIIDLMYLIAEKIATSRPDLAPEVIKTMEILEKNNQATVDALSKTRRESGGKYKFTQTIKASVEKLKSMLQPQQQKVNTNKKWRNHMQKNNPTDIHGALKIVNMFDMQHILSGGLNTEHSLYTIANLLNTRNNTMVDYYQGALGVLQQTSVINWHDLDQSIKMRNEDRIIDLMYLIAEKIATSRPDLAPEVIKTMEILEKNNQATVDALSKTRREIGGKDKFTQTIKASVENLKSMLQPQQQKREHE
ncbi:MAG: hypothetical protein MJ165_01150 [Alphaproteobacteria bacterium]|nr:hypothetical protein [Alphaproteobacteria bacterium]